ncbi:glycoside hydrolase family 26 protein [Pseudorhodoferax sp. Leaf274]|uniref:glycoside hydrolase family 26 protein n=1 Tax=Pseudorhodoferax sp. Leaf274 TaxID=1736318 RepID=UPI0007025C4D|nr:glycosyl hydrolase [Pseudorhodoferax sp. Leaf274]KQP37557.1 hypothetical protein ASF44_14520 [Pseudorhodoferax sp. Leaf274]
MRRNTLKPSLALPVSTGATAQTISLYRWLMTQKKSFRYALGTSDQFINMPAQSSVPVWTGAFDNFRAVTGKNPGVLGVEWHDPQWANRWGSAGTAECRRVMIEAYEQGAILTLHNHPGNPDTGNLSRNGTVSPTTATGEGTFKDRTGSPLSVIKPGGSKRAEYLAYLDRLADFLASLVDSKGRKIPVILRWWHEATGDWFWWNGVDRASDFILLWRDFVNYLRDVKGLTHVLYCWNVDGSTGVDPNLFWPGSSYVDIISMDTYDNRNDASVSLLGQNNRPAGCWSSIKVLASTHNKPLCIPELGYQYCATLSGIWDQKTGRYLATTFYESALAALWPAPYGPQASDGGAAKASFSAMAISPYAMTADRLTGVYV